MLLCETMKANESILIEGSLQYSTTIGYSDSLTFEGKRTDLKEQKRGDRLLAIDAKFFTSYKAQFTESSIFRDLDKLTSGLSCAFREKTSKTRKNSFASGNWGCGAFGGTIILFTMLR